MNYEAAQGTSQVNNPINMVGRHHAGGSGGVGKEGTANFINADNSGFNATVFDTVDQKQWGSTFYALTGPNKFNFQW